MSRPAPIPEAGAPRGLMALLALTAFVGAGGIHYQSPMLAAIAGDFGADAATVGWIPTLSFGGMLVGIVLLVPLGDRIDKRILILGKLAVLAVAQAAMALAPSIAVLAGGSLVSGVCSSVGQSLIAIVAETARPAERGRAVGTLFTALFLGLLFARIVGGLIASHLGWRYSYVLSVALLAALLAVLLPRLPSTRPTTTVSYPVLMASLGEMLRTRADIRRAAAIQFLLGICYGGFWATVAPMLAAFHRIGPAQAGLIGIPGAAGIFVARPAGRWMDRAGAAPVVTAGALAMLLAWATIGLSAWTVAAAVAGAILLDCGLRAAMVANQTLVNAAVPASRARANTVFGAHVWGGNAVGAYLASTTFAHFGWGAVCGVTMTCAALALALQRHAVRGARA